MVRMGIRREALFLSISKSLVRYLQVHFVPGEVNSAGALSTHHNGRLLLVDKFWGLSRV